MLIMGRRERPGSTAQVQNGLVRVFRHVGEQVHAVFRHKIMLVFVYSYSGHF